MTENYENICKRFRKYIAESKKNSDDAKLSSCAIDSFENAMRTGQTDEGWDKIKAAAMSSRRDPKEMGLELLLALSEKFPETENVWREFLGSKNGRVRLIVVLACWDERIPFELVEEITAKALSDKSVKVRKFAIDRIFIRCVYSLMPAMKDRENVETDKRLVRIIQWALEHMEEAVHPSYVATE